MFPTFHRPQCVWSSNSNQHSRDETPIWDECVDSSRAQHRQTACCTCAYRQQGKVVPDNTPCRYRLSWAARDVDAQLNNHQASITKHNKTTAIFKLRDVDLELSFRSQGTMHCWRTDMCCPSVHVPFPATVVVSPVSFVMVGFWVAALFLVFTVEEMMEDAGDVKRYAPPPCWCACVSFAHIVDRVCFLLSRPRPHGCTLGVLMGHTCVTPHPM